MNWERINGQWFVDGRYSATPPPPGVSYSITHPDGRREMVDVASQGNGWGATSPQAPGASWSVDPAAVFRGAVASGSQLPGMLPTRDPTGPMPPGTAPATTALGATNLNRGPYRVTVPGAVSNASAATDDFNRLNLLIGSLTPDARTMWLADPGNIAEFNAAAAAAGREPYSPEAYSWLSPETPTVPPAVVPSARPGAVTNQEWNNPDAEAPRGYNPELWAQREIGPNRTYQGGVTGMGIGGPTNQDGTAMYAAPAPLKLATDPMGYEPANLFQRHDFEGRFGDSGSNVLSNAAGNTFERNLLASIAEADDPRARFIMSALSNPASIRDAQIPGMWQQPDNLIDRAGAIYDARNSGPQRRTSSSEEKPVREGRDRSNPFMPRMAKGTVAPRRDSVRPSNDYTTLPAGGGPNPFFAWSIAEGLDPANMKNRRMWERTAGPRPDKSPVTVSLIEEESPNQWVPGPVNPFSFTGPTPVSNTRTIPVSPVSPGGMGASWGQRMPPIRQTFPTNPTRQPVMTMPSQRFPVDPGRRAPLVGAPHNPFLMGGARASLNPFR